MCTYILIKLKQIIISRCGANVNENHNWAKLFTNRFIYWFSIYINIKRYDVTLMNLKLDLYHLKYLNFFSLVDKYNLIFHEYFGAGNNSSFKWVKETNPYKKIMHSTNKFGIDCACAKTTWYTLAKNCTNI